ncbi:MAG: ECF transporter S component [Oscillospiraceae bacterium]|nr:ECF transporter S component [Oscillospiraceae bacterium]
MKKEQIIKLCVTGMFTALICLATMVIQIPAPLVGVLNLGDCFILVAAWILGPWYGFAAGGIGSALADLFTSYAQYIPATLIIKGLMAVAAALLVRAFIKKSDKTELVAVRPKVQQDVAQQRRTGDKTELVAVRPKAQQDVAQQRQTGGKSRLPGFVVSGLAAEMIMVSGYYFFEAAFLQYGWIPTLVNIPSNCVQGAFGLVLGVALIQIIVKTGVLKKFHVYAD